MSQPLLVIRGLTKTFPGTVALDNVDLTLESGSITAIVGHNGSGKSTLVKTLAGLYRPDRGTIETPRHGQCLHFIHQDLGLIDDLSVVENLNLGLNTGPAGLGVPRSRHETAEVRRLVESFGVRLDPLARVRGLAPAERTMVAIARAMSRWDDPRQVLVLDEPTARLQERDAEVVLAATRRVADQGAAVLYISHRLREVQQIADHVEVLRDGRKVATLKRGEFTSATLVDFIAGEVADADPTPLAAAATIRRVGDARLSVSGLQATHVHGVDLTVHSGEIVGVSGVTGSGVDDILSAIFGGRARTEGNVEVDGHLIRPESPRASIAAGMGYVPADRHRHAAVLHLTARENLTLPYLKPLRRALGAISGRAERDQARLWFDRAAIVPSDPERVLGTFSGGNQQKVILARWMRTRLKVLLLEEPTQGVDVGAQEAIYALIRQTAAEGVGVVVASSDTKELVELCDRVIVLVEGHEIAQLSGSELRESELIRRTLSSDQPTGELHEMKEK